MSTSQPGWYYPGQGPNEGRYTEFSHLTGYEQQPGNAPVASRTDFHPFQRDSGVNVASFPGEGMSQTITRALQAPPHQSFASILSVQPPPNNPDRHPAPHDSHATQAFTESSRHPSVAHRMILDDILCSTWIHNQDREPWMTDDYSKDIHRKVAHLNGCPAFDFSSSTTSLLTVFVGKSGGRYSCLICDKCKGSIPRALSCIRAHLQLKPFRCGGCQACNETNGYAAFWSAALLRGHVSGQRTVTCTECGTELRQGNLRRHWTTMHEDVEELLSFLLDDEESD